MSARDAYQSLDRYVQPLQSALHCITPAKLWRGSVEPDVHHILAFDRSPSIQLRRRSLGDGQRYERVHLSLLVGYRINRIRREPYRVTTVSYQYAITNQQQREIITFHWHPEGISEDRVPHLHVGSGIVDAGAGDFGKTFSNFHIPTGHISIAQVVRLLLTDFNVVPNRQDWEATIARLLMADV